MKILYIANDGNKFETESECVEHEKILKKKELEKIQQTMCELDIKIWQQYYPNNNTEEKPALHMAGTWLKNDIVHILTDDELNTKDAEENIISMIKATDCHEKILTKYILMDKIQEEVKIRKNYQKAFNIVKEGSDLANKLDYILGKNDLKQMAKLHKSNKCRKKIESLLTACNFHYECGKFINKEYAEFLN